tara:strand:- start:25 stop:264 length:240 start_codon:yes stop_codon:yes gene_type:complete
MELKNWHSLWPLIAGFSSDSFDVWEDTVNIAARLESSGEQGKIHITEKTSNYLGEKGIVTHRGEINLKKQRIIEDLFLG